MGFPNNIVGGSFEVLWDGMALGRTDDGWRVEITHKGETITLEETGMNVFDQINMGAEVTIEGTLKEWNSIGVTHALWPWYRVPNTTNAMGPNTGLGYYNCPAGGYAVAGEGNVARELRMNPVSCSPAATEGSWVFPLTIMAPDFASQINFSNMPRLVPIRFTAFMDFSEGGFGSATDPNAPSGEYRYFYIV